MFNANFYLFVSCGYIYSDRDKSFISHEFVSFMPNLRIPTSKKSVYNPVSNRQHDKYNDIIWFGVKLALKDQNFPILKWEVVLPKVLHSMSSLLCTATNSMPHEHFLNFQRRSILGISTPSWPCSPRTVLVQRHVCHNKYGQLVLADLIHATPQYVHIQFKNSCENTVSLKDVTPVIGPGSSNQSWYETIPLEPKKVIHDGFSPRNNASTHHEHDMLSPKLPDEEDKSLHRESNGDTPTDQVVLR